MVGVIGIIAVQILKSSVQRPAKDVEQAAQSGTAAVPYIVALVVLYKFTNKHTSLLLCMWSDRRTVHLCLAGFDLDHTQVVSLHSSYVMLQFIQGCSEQAFELLWMCFIR